MKKIEKLCLIFEKRWAKQIILKMKLTTLILLLAIMQVAAKGYSQAKKFDFKFERITIKEALNEVEDATQYKFLYQNELIDVNKRIDLKINNQSIDEILDGIFKDNDDVIYKIFEDKLVVLSTLSAQQQSVNGQVTDNEGIPLPGVSVVIKGSTTGTVTDGDGKYSISGVNENDILIFSFIGMKTFEVPVNGRSVVNVELEVETVGIEEVVAIGYGVQKKKLITGATVQIDGDDLQKINTVSPITAMQSQSPGLSITKTSGKPGSNFKINIRGLGTIGNASPLVIIDGIVGGDLNLINPADIESVDVLKDAASAAIYGARAANGVILLTTKKGKQGRNRISYDGYYGIQNIAKYVDMLDAQQYIDMQEEAHTNTGSPIPDWNDVIPAYDRVLNGWPGTDWQKEFTNENAPVQNHAVNLTGGSDLSTYSMGVAYTMQEGVYGQPQAPLYERYSFRLNSEHVIYNNDSYDVVKIGENLLYNFIDQKRDRLGTDNINWNDIRWVTRMTPLMPVYNQEGNYSMVLPWGGAANPIGMYDFVRTGNESKRHNLRINTYLEIQPVEDLVIKSSFGYQYSSNAHREYVPPYDLGGRQVEPLDRVDQRLSAGYNFQLENTINYDFSINDTHNFDLLLGQSIEKRGMGESMYARNRGMIFNSFKYAYLSNVKELNPSNIILNGTPWADGRISSFFGRLNYNYNETYMLSGILRADGSSNFAEGNRWGYFPSVSAGWLIMNEPFMESVEGVMDYLKLRASWGQNGNQNIDPFQYLATYSFSGADYYFGPEKDSYDVGAYPSILPNPDVTWETSEQLNIGLDARFFDSRMGLNVDWYQKTTRDWLVQAPVPATWGASAPFINGGDIENKGVEIVLSWNNNVGDFTYGINANVAFNKNEVTRIDNAEGVIEGGNTPFSTADRSAFYRAQVGYPIGYFYGYETAGVFQNQAEIDNYTGAKLDDVVPGDVIFVDQPGEDGEPDGVIDSNDKTMIGNPNPDAIFGFTFNCAYKGFDLSVAANGVAGNQLAFSLRQVDGIFDNWPVKYLERWHGEGTSNRYPRVEAQPTPSWGWNSDLYVEDGDFLRIQNITLGYDFKKLAPQMMLSQARLYVAVNNLYTFTSYYGADPEVGHADEGWSKGIDVGFYPTPRTVMLGVNLKF